MNGSLWMSSGPHGRQRERHLPGSIRVILTDDLAQLLVRTTLDVFLKSSTVVSERGWHTSVAVWQGVAKFRISIVYKD